MTQPYPTPVRTVVDDRNLSKFAEQIVGGISCKHSDLMRVDGTVEIAVKYCSAYADRMRSQAEQFLSMHLPAEATTLMDYVPPDVYACVPVKQDWARGNVPSEVMMTRTHLANTGRGGDTFLHCVIANRAQMLAFVQANPFLVFDDLMEDLDPNCLTGVGASRGLKQFTLPAKWTDKSHTQGNDPLSRAWFRERSWSILDGILPQGCKACYGRLVAGFVSWIRNYETLKRTFRQLPLLLLLPDWLFAARDEETGRSLACIVFADLYQWLPPESRLDLGISMLVIPEPMNVGDVFGRQGVDLAMSGILERMDRGRMRTRIDYRTLEDLCNGLVMPEIEQQLSGRFGHTLDDWAKPDVRQAIDLQTNLRVEPAEFTQAENYEIFRDRLFSAAREWRTVPVSLVADSLNHCRERWLKKGADRELTLFRGDMIAELQRGDEISGLVLAWILQTDFTPDELRGYLGWVLAPPSDAADGSPVEWMETFLAAHSSAVNAEGGQRAVPDASVIIWPALIERMLSTNPDAVVLQKQLPIFRAFIADLTSWLKTRDPALPGIRDASQWKKWLKLQPPFSGLRAEDYAEVQKRLHQVLQRVQENPHLEHPASLSCLLWILKVENYSGHLPEMSQLEPLWRRHVVSTEAWLDLMQTVSRGQLVACLLDDAVRNDGQKLERCRVLSALWHFGERYRKESDGGQHRPRFCDGDWHASARALHRLREQQKVAADKESVKTAIDAVHGFLAEHYELPQPLTPQFYAATLPLSLNKGDAGLYVNEMYFRVLLAKADPKEAEEWREILTQKLERHRTLKASK